RLCRFLCACQYIGPAHQPVKRKDLPGAAGVRIYRNRSHGPPKSCIRPTDASREKIPLKLKKIHFLLRANLDEPLHPICAASILFAALFAILAFPTLHAQNANFHNAPAAAKDWKNPYGG